MFQDATCHFLYGFYFLFSVHCLKPAMSTSTHIRIIFDNIFDLWLCFLLSGLGIITNIKCVAVFRRQGFQESATISLTVISILDLVKCVVGLAHRAYGLIRILDCTLAENWLRTTYLLNFNVQNMAGTLVNVITMYVTFERCLCVCVPFKVKLLVTKRVTYISIAGITLVVISTLMPPGLVYKVIWRFDTNFNLTMAQYASTSTFPNLQIVIAYTNFIFFFWITTTLVIIVMCTTIIILRLKHFSKFRSLHESHDNNQKESSTKRSLRRTDSKHEETPASSCSRSNRKTQEKAKLSNRDTQLVKMLLLLVAMYLVNVIPRLIVAVYRAVEPEFYVNRRYHDLYMTFVDLLVMIEFVNSSTNLFIYLAMSSHFRTTYKQVFVFLFRRPCDT